jgi:hypothetical protein
MIQHARVRRVSCWLAAGILLSLASGCSAGDPPNPDAARAGTTASADPDEERNEPAEEELSDADDATLDALEEQFEDRGVKDIRGKSGRSVTIRLEDELTIGHAVAVCTAVRSAGFAAVRIDIDGNVTPCP